MRHPTDAEISAMIFNIVSDGFNRSLGALRDVRVIDEKKLAEGYRGVGSEYYDLVTEQIEFTTRYAVPAIRRLFTEEQGNGT